MPIVKHKNTLIATHTAHTYAHNRHLSLTFSLSISIIILLTQSTNRPTTTNPTTTPKSPTHTSCSQFAVRDPGVSYKKLPACDTSNHSAVSLSTNNTIITQYQPYIYIYISVCAKSLNIRPSIASRECLKTICFICCIQTDFKQAIASNIFWYIWIYSTDLLVYACVCMCVFPFSC